MTTPTSTNITTARSMVFDRLTLTRQRLYEREQSWSADEVIITLANIGRAKRLMECIDVSRLAPSAVEHYQASLDYLNNDPEWRSVFSSELTSNLLDSVHRVFTDPKIPDLEKMRWIVQSDHFVVALSLAHDLGVEMSPDQLIKDLDALITPELESIAPIAPRVQSFVEAQQPTGAWSEVLRSILDAPTRLAELNELIVDFDQSPDPRVSQGS